MKTGVRVKIRLSFRLVVGKVKRMRKVQAIGRCMLERRKTGKKVHKIV